MKCILVDVKNNKVKTLEIEPKLQNYYDLIGCNLIDIVSRKLGDKYYDIICDDEGLLKENPIISALDSDKHCALVGNLIICHCDSEGYETSLTDEDIEDIMKNHIAYYWSENGLKIALFDVEV